MSELPKGWVECKLGDVMSLVNGRAYKKHEMLDEPIGTNPILRIQNLNGGDNWFYSDLNLDDNKYCYKGDLLYAWSATFGPYWAKWDKAIFHYHIWNVKPTNSITLRFSYYILCRITAAIKSAAHGVAMPHMTKSGMEGWSIQVPSLAEQKRIVEKLDEVLALVDTIKARLDGIPAILKRFRQSVLVSAVSGKLTEEWCKSSNSSAKNDLTKELLENTAKTRKVEQTSSHELVVNKFPSAWRKTTFTELYKFIDYRGKTPKKSENGFRLYTAKNIKMGFVSNEPVEYLSESDYEAWMTRGFSRPGDIFFVTEGHTMGCTAINDLGSEIALAQRTLTLQPYGNVNTRFHHYYMMSDSFQKLVDLNATGSAAKGIKAAKFRGLPLPFPSYEEQNEIVRLVDQYFAFADTIEAQVKKAQARVNNLTQSILAKAFRGELVPQDPNDEPADKLLERIAQARKEAEALTKAAKKAAPKKRTTKAKTTA